MPAIYKLSPEEVQLEEKRGKPRRHIATEEYDTMLAGFKPPEWGEVTLAPDESRTVARNRLKAAAQRRGLGIRFERSNGDTIRFELQPGDAAGE